MLPGEEVGVDSPVMSQRSHIHVHGGGVGSRGALRNTPTFTGSVTKAASVCVCEKAGSPDNNLRNPTKDFQSEEQQVEEAESR